MISTRGRSIPAGRQHETGSVIVRNDQDKDAGEWVGEGSRKWVDESVREWVDDGIRRWASGNATGRMLFTCARVVAGATAAVRPIAVAMERTSPAGRHKNNPGLPLP